METYAVKTMDRREQVSPERRLVSPDLRHFLQSRLNSLPLKQREVLELCFYDGLTQREIATAMATPLRAVKIRLALGLRRIAKQSTPFARRRSRGCSAGNPPAHAPSDREPNQLASNKNSPL